VGNEEMVLGLSGGVDSPVVGARVLRVDAQHALNH
jgi:NH3-dependent NAD+ synthetase